MNWGLLLDYVIALKWVAFATVVLILFRTSFGRLIDRLTKFEGFGAKADFERQAAVAVEKVRKAEAAADAELTAHVEATADSEVSPPLGPAGRPMYFKIDFPGELEVLALFLRHPERVARVAVNNRLDEDETNSVLHALTLLAIATSRRMEYDGHAFLMSPDRSHGAQ